SPTLADGSTTKNACPRTGRSLRRTARNESPSASSSLTRQAYSRSTRSEEHTSELQSRFDLVCRLLLEKKKKKKKNYQKKKKKIKINNKTYNKSYPTTIA